MDENDFLKLYSELESRHKDIILKQIVLELNNLSKGAKITKQIKK